MNTLRVLRSPAFQSLRRLSTKEISKFPEEPLGLPVAERGGFYAAGLNSTLNSRYILIGKLGWGLHSSVWLARDTRQNHPHPCYVAIKILSTHATNVQGRLADELGILQRINAHTNAHPGHKHIATLLDNFTVKDYHGSHLCLVSKVLGGFNGTVRRPGQKLPVPFVKIMTRQLLLALDFLHRECGIVHTDIKPGNILFALPNVEEIIQRYISEGSEVESLPSKPGSSPPVVLSRPIDPYTLDDLQNADHFEPKLEIQLTDFGTATTVDGFHADIIQPYALRAPEVILGNGWDTSADIWNLGCLIFEFSTGKWLFHPRSGPNWTVEQYHLGCMPFITGEEYDVAYVRKGEYFEKYFTPQGHLRVGLEGAVSLEQALDYFQVLDDVDKPLCVDFLRSMLRLRPSDRASAAKLLEHAWIKG